MNRIIKFRAWDKTFKRMIAVDVLEWQKFSADDSVCYIRGEFKDNFLGQTKELQTDSTTIKNIELMQFTGLTDKNGKEIYEGDIFNCIYNFDGCKDHKQVVVYVETSARFITKDYGECHQPRVTQTMSDMHRMEIIGNIYESKHLIDNT